LNALQLHWCLPNPARNLDGAGLGQIWEKWPDFGFAGAGAEIRCNPTKFSVHHPVVKREAKFGK